MKKKIISLALVFAMALALGIGGTIAWLTDTTNKVENTFTVGNIDIELKETNTVLADDGKTATKSFKMVPGSELAKDPKVTVKADSEACWLFVKIEESENLDSFIGYSVAEGWTELTGIEGVSGVYYRQVAAGTVDQVFSVLTGDKVAVKDNVTKDMMDALTGENAELPTLSFTAYAIQSDNLKNADENAADTAADTAAEAWALLNP